ncbi:MAG: flagellar hook-length control protein FliK [Polynucleobacter sp.]|nr:flagellar hook-length control protein FliK [Polynucleobacter sp.]
MTSVNTNAQVATQNTNINGAQGQSQGDQEGNLDFLFMAELDIASMARLADVVAPPVNTATTEPETIAKDDAQTSQDLILTNLAADPAIFADLSQLAAQMLIQNNANNANIANKAQSNQDAIDSIASQATSAGIANQQLLNALNASQTQVQNQAPSLLTTSAPNIGVSQLNTEKNFEFAQTPAQLAALQAKSGLLPSEQEQLANAIDSKLSNSTPQISLVANGVDSKGVDPKLSNLTSQISLVANGVDSKLSNLTPQINGVDSKLSNLTPPISQMVNGDNSKASPLNTPASINMDIAKMNSQLMQATPNVVAQAQAQGQKSVTPQVSLNGLTRTEEATAKILYVNPNYDESINSPKSFISSVGAQNTADNLISNPGMRSMVESRLFENTLQAEKIEQKIGDEIMVDQAAGLLAGAGFSQPMHSGSLKLEATNTSLAAGPLYNEVMSAAKSGGGRIVLEVNPDNMGPIQIDLQIDQNGQALMIVNGASDATQARLEQGSSQLRQEFAQMGLNLSLDMRQNSASNHFNQGGNGNSNPFNNSAAQQSNTSLTNSNKLLNINTLSSNRSNADRGSSGVNLFA